jgi:hypothetical protein
MALAAVCCVESAPLPLITPADEDELTVALKLQAQDAAHTDDLIEAAKQWLFARRILIPSSFRLLDWARAAFSQVEDQNLAVEDFRREIHTLLDRGESVHQLQRAVYSGKVATERGRRRDEMQTISGSHALLANVVLAWNTGKMHETVERLRRSAVRIEDEWLRRMGPAHFGHINFRGTMQFGIDRFAQSLIDNHADSARQLRLVRIPVSLIYSVRSLLRAIRLQTRYGPQLCRLIHAYLDDLNSRTSRSRAQRSMGMCSCRRLQ